MMKAIVYLTTLALLITTCNRGSDGISPTHRELTEAVYASGNAYPRNEYTVTADATGVLQQRLVNEGDSIRRNQLLFVPESATEDARRQAAANAYQQSRANLGTNSPVLAEGEAQVRNARTRLSNDSINYNRFRELYGQNATSRAELERAELNHAPANRPANSPAVSSSAWPLPAPSSTTPPLSWATNRRAI